MNTHMIPTNAEVVVKLMTTPSVRIYNDRYILFSDGSLWSNITGSFKKPTKNNCGYLYYCINPAPSQSIRMLVHRLVAKFFIGEPPFPKAVVHHIDNDKENNCLNNIEYTTQSENLKRRNYKWSDEYKRLNSIRMKQWHKQRRALCS